MIHGHPERPKACEKYKCMWLAGWGPEEARPDRVHFLFGGHEEDEVLEVRVDTKFPEIWKDHELIEAALEEKHLLVVVGRQLTFVPCKRGEVPTKIMVDWTL